MLFDSTIFIYFLFFNLLIFYFIKNRNKKIFFLIISSVFFYSYDSFFNLFILFFSIFVNFFIYKQIDIQKKTLFKKNFLFLGLFFNISLLFYFKYLLFFLENINLLFHTSFTFNNTYSLPLAISFFTFQQIAFLVDTYKFKHIHYSFKEYLLFIIFFPQLIAGPIVHHSEFIPQIKKLSSKIDYKKLYFGLILFFIGLIKKVIFADTFSKYTSSIHNNTDFVFDTVSSWLYSLSYTFQIYFDFSGYSDMAIGIALMFGITLPINFNSPYKAKNIQEFWNRWHITLYRFLKDYIYIPLGGSKKGKFRKYFNILIVFLLSGFWHGASWNFILWGILHGFAIIFIDILNYFKIKIHFILSHIFTFLFIVFTWVIFSINYDFSLILNILTNLFSFKLHFLSTDENTLLIYLIISFFLLFFKNSNELLDDLDKSSVFVRFFILFILSFIILKLGTGTNFIYFKF